MTQFVSHEQGRECLRCSAILPRTRAKYCNNACRVAANGFQPPKGKPFPRGDSAEWPSERILHLRSLWDEGHSTAQIGLRLGMSKNAIIGKSHRLHLPSRPSPISRLYGPPRPPGSVRLTTLGGAKRDSVGAVRGSTLAPLSSLVRRTAPIIPPKGERAVRVPQDKTNGGRVEPCCFPIGDPGTKGFRYCDDPSEPGRPYCAVHMKVAYIRTPRISMAGLVV